MNASDLHNLLSARFVREVIGPAIKSSELMVLFESCQTGMLEILSRHYELSPQVATGLMEASLHRAVERFAAQRKDRK